MKSAGVTSVNMSRHHHDERLNQEVMRLRPELSNAELASSVARIINAGMDVRMQCNLIKGYVDSTQGILDYINWCTELGCSEVSFSQVFPLSLFDYQTPPEANYTEKAQINLRRLVSDMDACGKLSPAPENHLQREGMSLWGVSMWGKGARRRFWLDAKGTYISLKTLSGYDKSGLPKETTYNKQDDCELQDGILAFAVLHSDGRVTASWDRRERQLFGHDVSTKEKVGCRKSFTVPKYAEVVAVA